MAVLLVQWWLAVAGLFHPFFVSVTEVNHNAKDKTLEVSCKLFFDDMEAVLKQNYKTVADLSKKDQEVQNSKLLADYMAKHLALAVNGKAVTLKFLGYEKDGESVYCYLEADGVAAVQNMAVKDDLLHDFTQQQINIIHCMVGGKRQSTKLDYPVKTATFKF